MLNVVPCAPDGNAQLMALEMGLALPDDDTESFLSPKAENALDITGPLALHEFQDRKGIDSLFGVLEPRPVVPFSKRPPKAIENIYNSLPSVERFFPDWPFYPFELPQSIPEKLKRKDAKKFKSQQGWNKELRLTRVHAPGTAAHRLWNHSFKQDVKDFFVEYETFRRNGFQTLPDEQKMASEQPTPYMSGVFRCSLCKFSPQHDDIPNWLYYTKVNANSPRYFYCLGCKGSDGNAQVKSFTNLMAMVEKIVAICHAEEDAKKVGMDGAITSVPLAKFKRYEIMFSIEVEAAMVRRAIKTEKTQLVKNAEEFRQRQLEKISGDFGLSVVGKTVAKEIVGRYLTTEIPKLFDTLGPLGQPERTTPPGFPMGMESRNQHAKILPAPDEEVQFPVERPHTPRCYIPPVIAGSVHQGDYSQASPGRPLTPVWFAERQTTPSTFSPPAHFTTPLVYPRCSPSLERVHKGSTLYAGATQFTDTSTPTPSGYPELFTPQSHALYEEPDLFTDATTTLADVSTARSSPTDSEIHALFNNISAFIHPEASPTESEIHAPFRNFSAFIHPEDESSRDHTPPEYPEGVMTLLTPPDTPPSSTENNEPLYSARSSRTLYEDYTPQFGGVCDSHSSSARSSITVPEDFGQQLADTVVERSSRRSFETFGNRPFVDDKQESEEGSLTDQEHALRHSPAVQKKDSLGSDQHPRPSPTGDNSLYLRSHGGIPARLPPKTERIPPARIERASYDKYEPEAISLQKTVGMSFYRTSTDAQPMAQFSRALFSTTTRAQPPTKLDRATFYNYNPDATTPREVKRLSFYKCKNQSTGRAFSHKSLSSITEENLKDDPESDFSDISTDWDSDESFDEHPRRLRCLDLLDELIPQHWDKCTGYNSRVWNSRPMGKRGRNVDLSLKSILEDTELEEREPEGGASGVKGMRAVKERA
ncbi:hypothetical protein BGX38DRAFT_1267948 [Terfezia claveryi]|nr:hypothetical protein BGX38DRAFT_1267948 [Terfezia claveryi]